MVKAVKAVLLFILIWIFFWLINSGFGPDVDYSQMQTLIFTVTTVILIYRSSLRVTFIILAITLFIIMTMVTVFFSNMIEVANFFGSLAFGLLVISSIFYIPQLVRRGFIKNL